MTRWYRKPDILDKIDTDRHTVIEASAGTGKTYTIEHLVIELLLQSPGCPLEEILVLTYTERAAAELRLRIRETLQRLLDPGKTQSEPPTDGPGWCLDADNMTRLTNALHDFDSAAIHTIHGFFHQVLREHAFLQGRLFTQTLADAKTLFREAFFEALIRDIVGDPAREFWFTHCLTNGNPESELKKIDKLLLQCHKGQSPLRPLFDKQALTRLLNAEDLFQVFDVVATQARKLKGSGSRNYGTRLQSLRTEIETFRDDENLDGFLTRINLEWFDVLCDAAGHGHLAAMPARWRTFITELATNWISPRGRLVQELLPAVQGRLEGIKQDRALMDFDDMIVQVDQAIQDPGSENLLAALRSRYHIALIDEAQDTDPIQWRVFRRLFLDSRRDNRIFLIGDPKQAIYAFRNADVHAYLAARRDVCAQSEKIVLDRNFRSTPELVERINQIFDQRTPEPFFAPSGPDEESITYDSPVNCGRQYLRLVDSQDQPQPPLRLIQIANDGTKRTGAHLRRIIGPWIAAEIAARIRDPAPLRMIDDVQQRPVSPQDIFVLASTNNEAREMGECLAAAGVPYAFYKQEGLFQTDEARDVLDLLAAVANPDDRHRRGLAYMTPFFSISPGELPGLLNHDDRFGRQLNQWHKLAVEQRFEPLFEELLEESGLARQELFFSESLRCLTNYQHLLELLLERSRRRGDHLDDLVFWLDQRVRDTDEEDRDQSDDILRLESEQRTVQVMTIHKSKGLEADIVYFFGGFGSKKNTQGDVCRVHQHGERVIYVDPTTQIQRLALAQQQEEHRRLIYVALTRARGQLVIPYATPAHCSDTNGCYWLAQRQLQRLLTEPSDNPVPVESLDPTTVQSDVPDRNRSAAIAMEADPSQRLPDEPPADDGRSATIAEIRQRHAAWEVTSYTRMKKEQEGFQPSLVHETFKGEMSTTTEVDQGRLPGGAGVGIFLHEVLEHLDLGELRAANTFDQWAQTPAVTNQFADALTRHGLAVTYQREAQRLVYHALGSPIPLTAGQSVCLGSCSQVVRELEFLFPIPDGESVLRPNTERLRVQRGFVKGFVDYVFAHERRIYFVDWKTDQLPDYSAPTVANHVHAQYTLQARLYALALVRLLEIDDADSLESQFGGLLYVFLRAPQRIAESNDAESPWEKEGIYFHRPDWAEICSYPRELFAANRELS